MVNDTGETFAQYILGGRGVDTNDPRNIEAVLTTQFQEFNLGARKREFQPLLGDGIFTQDGQAWLHSRALLRPVFSQNRSDIYNAISDAASQFIELLPIGEVVDLQPLFFRFTLDTTTFLLFGHSIGALSASIDNDSKDEVGAFAASFDFAQETLAKRGRLAQLYWLMDGLAFRRQCRTVHTYVDKLVQQVLQNPGVDDRKPNYTILAALLEHTTDSKAIRDALLNILLAGRDTTGCLLSWTFRLLARHQQALSALRSEIEAVVGETNNAPPPTRADIKKMKYLDAVLKETLRLYPSVPIESRAAAKPTTLPFGGGLDGQSPVFVGKGEAVGWCPYVLHRRKDVYGEDADFFRPERWLEDDGRLAKIVGYAYLPFNAGPRVCLGQEFALLEAGFLVVRILQKFSRIELPVDEPDEPVGQERHRLTLVMASATGCRVVLND